MVRLEKRDVCGEEKVEEGGGEAGGMSDFQMGATLATWESMILKVDTHTGMKKGETAVSYSRTSRSKIKIFFHP